MYTIKVPNKLLGAHECEALVVTCIDFRFHEAAREFVRSQLGVTTFDLLTVPGACRGVAEKNDLGKYIADAIALAYRLHKIKKVIIINHGTCGAYGIQDQKRELATQIEDLKKADAILGDLFPDLSFQLFFAQKRDGEIVYLPIE